MKAAFLTACVLISGTAIAAGAPHAPSIYTANFASERGVGWKFVGGNWDTKEGVLAQTDTSLRDPKKAIVESISEDDSAGDVVAMVKLRFDSCDSAADGARAGVGLCTDPKTGRGLNLVLHDQKLRFLHDFVAWGPSCEFEFRAGRWYWLKLYRQASEPSKSWIDEGLAPMILKGKAWADGEEEPADWMISWLGHDDPRHGFASINGGSGPAQVSFAEFKVMKAAPLPKQPAGVADIVLDGTWRVRPAPIESIGLAGLNEMNSASDGWIAAQVPGEIHVDLIRAGQMEEPTVGVKMPNCRWPETRSWWYQTAFEVTDGFLLNERQELVFDGLDLYAQVFVNGQLLGESKDAFVPAVFDARSALRAGRNELVVRMTAGSELSRDSAAANGKIPNPGGRHWDGRRWLRKPAFEYGWDWVDALPNIGIWRSVRLEGRRHVVIDDLRLDTLRRDERVFVELNAVLENLHWRSGRACVFDLEIHPPDRNPAITRHFALDLPPGRVSVNDLIEIPNPQLWWPNGAGSQPLYRIVARAGNAAGETRDRREFSIGLRTIELDRSRMNEGARFAFRVNGQDIFCRGGNLGPHDPILARITDEKYRQLVADARDAHMNMFRINGCSIYEAPAFYEACDRAGIMIYHDFMFTDITYPDDDAEFVAAARAETETAVRMLRHHPCIAAWAGNNENTWLFSAAPGYGDKLYNQVFPELCMRIDPHRPYWPGSPAGGKDPNSEVIGECHWWEQSWTNPSLRRRITPAVYDDCRARFISEYGVIGPCHADSIREYLPAEERSQVSASWREHTNTYEGETLPAAIRRHYAEPEGMSLDDYSKYGQLFQSIMHRSAIEAMRFRKHDPVDDCAGVLMWSYSDCWGETGWSLVDYYLRRKASYYAARQACAPVKVITRKRGDHYVTRVVNDTLEPVATVVECGWRRFDGRAAEVASYPVTVAANGMTEVARVAAQNSQERDPTLWFYSAVLRSADGTAFDQSISLQVPYRQLQLNTPAITITPLGDRTLEIYSPTFAHGVHVEDHGREVLSENWFDLIPGVPIRVQVADGIDPAAIRLESAAAK